MIFKQVSEILEGRKTQTRRVVKPDDFAFIYNQPRYHIGAVTMRAPVSHEWDTLNGRPLEKIGPVHYQSIPCRWYVGNTYAVQSGRGKPGAWWRCNFGDIYHIAQDYPNPNRKAYLASEGFQPARIRITAIGRERLQDITEADAKAEGVESVEAYKALWQSINTKKGTRWEDNPEVWVLSFKVVTQ
jgi:hypothetical protein